MNLFEEEFANHLIEINNKLKEETDIFLKEQLLRDKEFILDYLYPKQKKKSFNYISTENEEEILKILRVNKINFKSLKRVQYPNNNKNSLDLFQKFIGQNIFNLQTILEKIKNYNGIKYLNKKSEYYGSTMYIASLRRNYIEVIKTNNIYEYTTLVHELGHAKINLQGNKSSIHRKKSSLGDVYPIFLELLFSDFIKDNGMIKESYEIKYLIFSQIKIFLNELSEEYFEYICYDDNDLFNKFIFDFKYRYLKSILLALQFYYMYKENAIETTQKINYFIKNIYKMSDEELLINLNIDLYFNNENISKLYNELKEQKEKIKRR